MSISTAEALLKKKISEKALNKRVSQLNRDKKPKTKDPYVGVEIEFITPKNEKQLDEIFAKLGLQNHVTMSDDGSIEVYEDNHTPCEIKVCVRESEVKRVLNRVGDALSLARAYVNDTCGVHIHVDHRDCTGRNPVVTYNNLFKMQGLIFSIVDKERRNNQFCQPNDNSDFYEQFAEQVEEDSRYFAINTLALEKYKTIEVRAFHGTVDSEEIYHFAQVVIAATKSKKIETKVAKTSELGKIKKFPKHTRDYLSKKKRRAA
jgi:putative lipoic acid-binding regulatory protein